MTNGRIARTPSTISTTGVLSQIDTSTAMAPCAKFALAIISVGETLKETNNVRINTAKIGNKEARVTIPKPDKVELPLPAALAMPIPIARTSGTVTGPVVTAPQSQANPSTLLRSGFVQKYAVKSAVGARAQNISGFKDHPYTNRNVPKIAAKPTPAPTIRTRGSVQLLSSSNKYGAFPTSIEEPNACKAPMAGSANVTPTPNMPIIINTTGMEAFLGKFAPRTLPNGIKPEFSPSMKAAKPTITANKPIKSVEAACIGY